MRPDDLGHFCLKLQQFALDGRTAVDRGLKYHLLRRLVEIHLQLLAVIDEFAPHQQLQFAFQLSLGEFRKTLLHRGHGIGIVGIHIDVDTVRTVLLTFRLVERRLALCLIILRLLSRGSSGFTTTTSLPYIFTLALKAFTGFPSGFSIKFSFILLTLNY